MKRYAGLIENDFANGKGTCVSFWVQGCPHRCIGCHNPETWNFNNGELLPNNIRGQIIKAISANGIIRNFSVLGGEPLCEENFELTDYIVSGVRAAYPQIKIFLWTGYTLEELQKENNKHINNILNQINILIDGRFIEAQKDLTLELRGSKNQRMLYKGIDF